MDSQHKDIVKDKAQTVRELERAVAHVAHLGIWQLMPLLRTKGVADEKTKTEVAKTRQALQKAGGEMLAVLRSDRWLKHVLPSNASSSSPYAQTLEEEARSRIEAYREKAQARWYFRPLERYLRHRGVAQGPSLECTPPVC